MSATRTLCQLLNVSPPSSLLSVACALCLAVLGFTRRGRWKASAGMEEGREQVPPQQFFFTSAEAVPFCRGLSIQSLQNSTCGPLSTPHHPETQCWLVTLLQSLRFNSRGLLFTFLSFNNSSIFPLSLLPQGW